MLFYKTYFENKQLFHHFICVWVIPIVRFRLLNGIHGSCTIQSSIVTRVITRSSSCWRFCKSNPKKRDELHFESICYQFELTFRLHICLRILLISCLRCIGLVCIVRSSCDNCFGCLLWNIVSSWSSYVLCSLVTSDLSGTGQNDEIFKNKWQIWLIWVEINCLKYLSERPFDQFSIVNG